MATEKVTIVVPALNAEAYMAECLNSACGQVGVAEVILVDNGSSDNTIGVARDFPDVRILRCEAPGAAAARNTGWKASRSRYVKFLDADDVLLAGTIENELDLISKQPGQCIFYGPVLRGTPGTSKPLPLKEFPYTSPGCSILPLVLKNIPTTSPTHDVDRLSQVGGFDDHLASRQEWNLHLRLAMSGAEFRYHDRPVYLQRTHSTPSRITNRPLDAEKEMRNLQRAISPLEKIRDANVKDAVAAYIWGVGRQFAARRNAADANAFFEWARIVAEGDFMRFQSPKYRAMAKFVPPSTLDIFYSYLPNSLGSIAGGLKAPRFERHRVE